MLKPVFCAVFFIFSLALLSCREQQHSEPEITASWKQKFIDSAYRLLYKEEDTSAALRYFDSSLRKETTVSVYPKAMRFDLLANYHYFFTNNNMATAAMIDSALSLYKTPELQHHYPRTYVGLLLFGGNMAYRLSQYSKANDYYFRAKKLADANLAPCERTSFHYSIAMVLYRQQNFSQSLDYFSRAYALQETCPQTTAVVLQQQEIQSNMGLCLVQLKNYDSALVHFNNCLQLANRYKDSLGAATMDKIYGVIHGNRAQVAFAKGQLEEAEQLCLKSIALNDRPGYEVENALGVKLQLAGVYDRMKKFGSMVNVLNGMQPAMATAAPRMQMDWHRLMASYCEQTGQTASSLLYLKQYFSLRDSFAEMQKQLTAADVARRLGEKEQEHQIAVLKKDQHITELWLWVTLLSAFAVVIIGVLLYYNYRRNKKTLAQSLALNEEIRKQKAAREAEVNERHKLITEAVIRAQENERSIIGLELHDNIGQVLTTVKLHNEMLLEGAADPKTVLPRTLQYLQLCINEIRSLSKRLSAPTLGKISLEESVTDLIDSINATSKVKITTHISGLGNEALRKDLHLGVYRILQEQLNNVLKHAEATEVTVELETREGHLHLSVTDNGKGFLLPGSKSGIGLMNMQTRAENLSGSFTLKSKPGQGCRVEVVLPCLQNR